MNFIVICLHSLDMRDFHSHLRQTPFLDELRSRSVFVPTGRAQSHHQADSLNAELTGIWTARMCDSKLTKAGYQAPKRFKLPKTIMERLSEHSYEIITLMKGKTHAVAGGMAEAWLCNEPERMLQFDTSEQQAFACNELEGDETDRWIRNIRKAKGKFYAHCFLRETHRSWGQLEGLCALAGEETPASGWDYPEATRYARLLAVSRPDEFAALRRRGLQKADQLIRRIFEETKDIPDTVYLVYSNHGEVFDHFRYHVGYTYDINEMVSGTSHGNFPYEILYSNMQLWLIPGHKPRVMEGTGLSIDIAPTLLELAKVPCGGLDGKSMIKAFSKGTFPVRERFAESYLAGGCISMVRDDGYKFLWTDVAYVKYQNGEKHVEPVHRPAVFHLPSDPYEYVNLRDTPKGREVISWAIEKHRSLKKLKFGRA